VCVYTYVIHIYVRLIVKDTGFYPLFDWHRWPVKRIGQWLINSKEYAIMNQTHSLLVTRNSNNLIIVRIYVPMIKY